MTGCRGLSSALSLRSSLRTRRQWLVATVSSAYPLSLLVAIAALRYVGERWWVTGIGLYLPRWPLAVPLPLIVTALVVVRLHRFLWTQVMAVLLLVFPLLGLVLPWPTAIAQGQPVVRVLSYNVNSEEGGADELVEEIDRYSPDIVLLQETAGSESLGSLLRARYPTIQAANQFLLATRYPLVSITVPEKLEYEGRQRSPRFIKYVLDTKLGNISVYNVHPLSPREVFYELRGARGLRREILSGRLFSSTSSTVFQGNSRLRTLQVQAISEAVQRETDPVLLVGDTNLPGLSRVLHRYLATYQDGFAKAGWGFGYTFPNRHPWMRIDRVFASNELRFVRFQVGSSLASDHRCVVADIQRRGP